MNKLLIAVCVLALSASAAQAGDPARADAPVPATRHVPLLDAYRAEAPLAQTPAATWAESNRIVAGQEGMAHGGHQMQGMHDMHGMHTPGAAPKDSTHDHAVHQPSKPQDAGKQEHGGHHGHDMKEHKQ